MATILIVEDDVDLVETYGDLLEAQGHSTISASRIDEASAQLHKMQPDIITLDLNLPGTSDAAIAAFVHSVKSTSRARLIVISGHPEMMSGSDWVEHADLVLTKPVDNQQLTRMVDRLLSQ